MKKLNLLFVLFIILASCTKNDSSDCPDCPSVDTNSAAISVKIVDNNQQVVENASVEISSSSDHTLLSCTTGATGICDAGKLLEGEYACKASSQLGKLKYSIEEYFQVISGENKTIEVNPYSNAGTVNITVMDSEPVPNITVALIPHPNYSNEDYSFDGLLEEAYFTGTTNQDGLIVFENVPALGYQGKVYSVMVYYDAITWNYPISNNSFYMHKDSEIDFTAHVNF